MSYNIYYFNLNESQINYIKSCINNSVPIKLSILKDQLISYVQTPTEGYVGLPLTNLQIKMVMHAKNANSDIVLDFHFTQIQKLAKINYNIDFVIQPNMNALYQNKARIRNN